VRELDEAHRAFLGAGNAGKAAACRIKAADALRFQGRVAEALTLYAEAEALARKANVPEEQARALTRQGRARLANKEPEEAGALAAAAVRLSAPLTDKQILLDALCLCCEVDFERGEWIPALDFANQALGIPEVKDEALLFYAYHDRASVYYRLSRVARLPPDEVTAKLSMALEDATRAHRAGTQMGLHRGAGGQVCPVREARSQSLQADQAQA
jgi:tetratricopeptide (TPR) repeat protein